MKLDLFDNLSLPNNNNKYYYYYYCELDQLDMDHHIINPFLFHHPTHEISIEIAQVQSLELSLFLNQEYSSSSSSSLLPIYPHHPVHPVGQNDNDNNTIQVDLHWRNNNNNNHDHALEELILFSSSFQPQWQPPQPPQISLNCISYGYDELGEHLINLNEINEITNYNNNNILAKEEEEKEEEEALKYQMMHHHHEEPLMQNVQDDHDHFLLDSQQWIKSHDHDHFLLDSQQWIKSHDHDHFLLDSQHMDLSQFHCLFNATREIMTLSADIPSMKKINGNLLLFLISFF